MSNAFESDPDLNVGDKVTVECLDWLCRVYKGPDRVFIVYALVGDYVELHDSRGERYQCRWVRGIRLVKPPRVRYDKYVLHMRRAVAAMRADEQQNLQYYTMTHYERLTNEQLQRRTRSPG